MISLKKTQIIFFVYVYIVTKKYKYKYTIELNNFSQNLKFFNSSYDFLNM